MAQHTPELFVCVEFWGNGDPFFGGQADDRTLMADGGGFYVPPRTGRRDYRPALFTSREDAIAAGERAPNRRKGGLIAGCPSCERDRQDGAALAKAEGA